MNGDRQLTQDEATNLRELEIEAASGEGAISVPFQSDPLRSKILYLFSGIVLLAPWWLVYDNLLAFARPITYQLQLSSSGWSPWESSSLDTCSTSFYEAEQTRRI